MVIYSLVNSAWQLMASRDTEFAEAAFPCPFSSFVSVQRLLLEQQRPLPDAGLTAVGF